MKEKPQVQLVYYWIIRTFKELILTIHRLVQKWKRIEPFPIHSEACYYPDYLNTKTRDITRKLDVIIYYEYGYKNLQQNSSKLNLTAYEKNYAPWKVGFSLGLKGWFNVWKSNNVMHHSSWIKNKITWSSQ